MEQEALQHAVTVLYKAGYHFPPECDNGFLCIIDPTCIWPPLIDFVNTAWTVLAFLTGVLLAGWAATMLRGAKHDMVKNLRTLVLIFGIASVALPAVNFLGGGQFVLGKCDIIKVPAAEVAEILNTHKLNQVSYEEFDIWDSQYDDPNELDF